MNISDADKNSKNFNIEISNENKANDSKIISTYRINNSKKNLQEVQEDKIERKVYFFN